MNIEQKQDDLKEEAVEEHIPGDEAEPESETPPEEMDWRIEAEKNLDQFLRAQADMANMKKRLEREKAGFVKFANEGLLKDLLPVLDNLERALEHANSTGDDQGLEKGLQLTLDGFINVFKKFGVKAISALGEKFDPNFHEAVMQREDPDVDDNTVLEVIQKGYLLNDRLLRPSMVVVSKRPA